MSRFQFSIVAATCLVLVVGTAQGQEGSAIPGQGAEALPSPSDLRVDPFRSEAPLAEASPAARAEGLPATPGEERPRQVLVNLVLSERPSATSVFRRKRGDVLAEVEKLGEPLLQFEVVITSPCADDVTVLFPVPKDSNVYRAYVQFGENDPDRVLMELAKIEPPAVSVIALNKPVMQEKWHDAALVACGAFKFWRPLYEVWLEEADVETPELVSVPRADHFLYDLTKSTINNSVCPADVERLLWLSEPTARYTAQTTRPALPELPRSTPTTPVFPGSVVPPASPAS